MSMTGRRQGDGLRAIDGCLTVGQGQRLGLFAGPGQGQAPGVPPCSVERPVTAARPAHSAFTFAFSNWKRASS